MVFPEGFEDAAAGDRWLADYGVWEIGVPTSGPGSAHGGSNCLATILSGNYTDDRRSRVVSPAFVVPEAGQNPRLRFWHWWSFSDDDFGQVQISTNNGTSWQALSPKYGEDGSWLSNYDSSGRWTRAWLDLTAMRARRCGWDSTSESHGGGNVAPGWYVDDMVIETGPLAVMVFPEGFEDAGSRRPVGGRLRGLGDWCADERAGECAWRDQLSGDDPFGQLPRRPGEPGGEPGLCGAGGGSESAAAVLALVEFQSRRLRTGADQHQQWGQLGGLSPPFTSSSARAWLYPPSVSLSAYAGQTVRLGFYFESLGGGNVAPGWYVDDIQLIIDDGPP